MMVDTKMLGLVLLGFVLAGDVYCNDSDKPVPVHFDDNSFTTVSAVEILRIATIQDEPYVTVREEVDPENDTNTVTKYEGFIVDVLEEIFKDTDFEYQLYLVHDGKYGARDRHTGEWSGLIGDVEKGKAHIAAAALSITDGRSRVVDFTQSWAEVNFTVVLQSDAPVSTLDELVNQKNISYGLLRHSSTEQAFKSTPTDPFATMWANMGAGGSLSEELFVTSNAEGIARVLNDSDYGFIAESTFAEYVLNTQCGLKTVGSFLSREGYGFAVQMDDTMGLKKVLDDALTEMEENGKLDELHEKYWGTETCDERNSAPHAQWLLAVFLCSLLTALKQL